MRLGLCSKKKILVAILLILSVFFVFSLFKNIAFPLLWNDEAETAMFGERVLDYGYPKVHDGKNVLCLLELPSGIGIEKNSDSYLGSMWGQYYFSSIGNFFARKTNDIYIKTAFLRIPFALIGLLGLVVMALSIRRVFGNNWNYQLLFLIFFCFFELLSVSLTLHLREVRYYSLVIFLSAFIIYIFIKHSFFNKINPFLYVITMTILLLALFNTFAPAYFIFLLTLGVYACFELRRSFHMQAFCTQAVPLVLSCVPVYFLLLFFKTFDISHEAAQFYGAFSCCVNMRSFFDFFRVEEFFYLALILKVVLYGFYFFNRKVLYFVLPRQLELFNKKMQISNFLSFFFLVYFFIIIRMPVPYLFERYYIVLQPILIIIFLLDAFSLNEILLSKSFRGIERNKLRIFVFLFLAIIFVFSSFGKVGAVKGHIFELFHRYKGPLDYAVPFIRSSYAHTERLVIATNYEECAYMYYLGSKVIVGCVGNNLKNDLKEVPDLIIFRKRFSYTNRFFIPLFAKVKYTKVSFPVFDYDVNNIPELNFPPLPHLFKTKMAIKEGDQLDIYLKNCENRCF